MHHFFWGGAGYFPAVDQLAEPQKPIKVISRTRSSNENIRACYLGIAFNCSYASRPLIISTRHLKPV